jgi:hypothetical protein
VLHCNYLRAPCTLFGHLLLSMATRQEACRAVMRNKSGV